MAALSECLPTSLVPLHLIPCTPIKLLELCASDRPQTFQDTADGYPQYWAPPWEAQTT